MSEGREDWCDIHKCSMQHYEKDGKGWYSHKTEDPAYAVSKGWCSNKPPKQKSSSGGSDVWKERKLRTDIAIGFPKFFSSLKEVEDYAILGKKPTAGDFNPYEKEPASSPENPPLGYPPEVSEEEPPF